MTRRETVLKTIAREPTEYVPYAFDLTSGMASAVHARLKERGTLAEDGFIGDYFQFVGSGPGQGHKNEDVGENRYRDEFGSIWDTSPKAREMGDCGCLFKPALANPSLKGYTFPDGSDPARWAHMDKNAKKSEDKYIVFGVMGLFDTCWRLRGFENFLLDIADGENTFCEEILDLGAEFICELVGGAPDCIDGVRFTEDWGLQKGLMMSPALWRRLLKPRLKKMYEAARSKNFNVIIHSCGDITEVLPDLIEIGVEVVNPIQPEAMDVHKIKREYGKYLTFYGGMGSQSTLIYGTLQDTIDEVEDRVRTLAKGGGYIIGPAGAVPRDGKLENVVKFAELCMNGLKCE